MVTIEWDQLLVKKDWENALSLLLAEARASCLEDDIDRQIACQKQLGNFINLSPTGVDELNQIALNASREIRNDQRANRIAAIDIYLEQIQNSALKLEGITTAVNQERSMHFTKTIEILNQASSSIDVLVKMEKQLTEPNQDLILRIDAVSKSIQELFVLADELKNG